MDKEDSYWHHPMIERTKLEVFIKKYEELLKAHNLDIELSVDTFIVSFVVRFRIVAKTANRDHITNFKTLGLVTGLYTVEQIESTNPTQWWFEVTPTVQ